MQMTKRHGQRRHTKSPVKKSVGHTTAKLETYEFEVQSLSHEGRGVALYSANMPNHPPEKVGKKVFIRHALVGEKVRAQVNHQAARFDEAQMLELLEPSAHRVMPICPHVDYCGGCSLQHLAVQAQLQHKQAVLASHLQHFAGISPEQWLAPIENIRPDYRRRARVSVRYLPSQKRLVMGFRAAASHQIQQISDCTVLDSNLNNLLQQLPELFAQLSAPEVLGHVELAKGDDCAALLIRHTATMPQSDLALLVAWAQQQGCQLYLQDNQGVLTRVDVVPSCDETDAIPLLRYALPDFALNFSFAPTDFTQVNAAVNAKMVKLACDLLQLQAGQRVLDLFCGLGNFALAMARQVGDTGRVVGVEGSREMVARATLNARQNAIAHAKFYTQDLTQNWFTADWARQQFDAILIDPPRTGAVELLPSVVQFAASKIVYVSCDPATLARDAGLLQQHGYTLKKVGIMDMFSHTSHVESIALFEKTKQITTAPCMI